MKVIIDGDGCPVTQLVITLAQSYQLNVCLICDTAHYYDFKGIEVIVVDQGKDAADFAIVKQVQKGDVIVTQDYGLAAMLLSKQAYVINPNGMEYTTQNIDQLLFSRHLSQKIRQSGGRLKGPSKRKKADDRQFEEAFNMLLLRLLQRK